MIQSTNNTHEVDILVLATNACCIKQFMSAEFDYLTSITEKISYQSNTAFIHTDTARLPQSMKKWNMYQEFFSKNYAQTPVIFWIGKPYKIPLLASARVPLGFINPEKIIPGTQVTIHHPIMTPSAMKAREELQSLQGKNNIWLVGNYMTGLLFMKVVFSPLLLLLKN